MTIMQTDTDGAVVTLDRPELAMLVRCLTKAMSQRMTQRERRAHKHLLSAVEWAHLDCWGAFCRGAGMHPDLTELVARGWDRGRHYGPKEARQGPAGAQNRCETRDATRGARE